MTSSEYWKKREADALKSYQKDEEAYYEEIQEIYADMMERIQKEIDSFYIKYAVKEDISMAEAKKRVSQLDIKAYARKAKKYVRNRDFSDKANEEMRLYNVTMKINRLEMLKANIGLELVSGYDELQKYFEQTLTDRTLDEFKRQAGILGETITDNAEMAHSIVNASFHNATFSDRIWMHQDVLKNQLSSLLQTGLIQGRNPRQLAVELRKYFNVGIGNSERLMRTELARVQTAAQKRSFEKNGFEEYEFIANGTACEKCAGLDGQHFKIAKMMPGTNAPPMHPNCRCSTAAYQDSAEYEAWLDFLDKGGSTEEWQEKNSVAKTGENDIIKSRNISERRMANGLRTSPYHILSDEEIKSVKKAAKELNIPENILRFNQGNQTGFSDGKEIINIRGDILPDKSSNNLRDILSSKAVLAHEYYGHYKNHPSQFRVGDWRDEFRASYCAALNAPNLNDEERRMLMLDAYDRAREAGVSVRYNKKARRLIYGYDE